eukprot:m.17081 g.17081  ORF g.17081 m.17081 type:complete len:186 (+) comp5894_c0_seq1:310-867(+)
MSYRQKVVRVPGQDFPPLTLQPLPLKDEGEVKKEANADTAASFKHKTLVSRKRKFLEACRASPYYINPPIETKNVERYSDLLFAAKSRIKPEEKTQWDKEWMGKFLELKAQKVNYQGKKTATRDLLKKVAQNLSGKEDDGNQDDEPEEEEIVEEAVDEDEEPGDYTNTHFSEDEVEDDGDDDKED